MRGLKISPNITKRDSQSLMKYFNDIASIPQMSREEEYKVAVKVYNGDDKALEKLVYSNLRFVVSVAKQYHNSGVELADLINEGNIGLINAARKFDPSKGFKFISYAVWHIRQCLINYLIANGQTIKIPNGISQQMRRVREVVDVFNQEHERYPTKEELLEIVTSNNISGNWSEKTINDIENAILINVKSMDMPIGEEDFKLSDIIENHDSSLDTYKDVNTEDVDSIVSALLNNLDKLDTRSRGIIELVYGLNGQFPMNKKIIAEKYGINVVTVDAIIKKSFRYLRKITSKNNKINIKELL